MLEELTAELKLYQVIFIKSLIRKELKTLQETKDEAVEVSEDTYSNEIIENLKSSITLCEQLLERLDIKKLKEVRKDG